MPNPVILGTLFSISVILAFKSVFLTKLLASGILFSTVAYSFLVARPPCFVILSPTNFIVFSIFELSVSYEVFKRNFVVTMLSTFVTNLSTSVFLTTSFFTTSISSLKLTGTSPNLSISNLSTSVFRLAEFDLSAKLLTSRFYLVRSY